MSTSSVLRLDEYRGRREQRLRLARALHGVRDDGRRLLALLETAVGILGADRAAVLWVDEYGPGLVHVHVLLDLVSDSPRRSFSLEPLRLAWNAGVPGILDAPDLGRSEIPLLRDTTRSTCAVALGSDGARAWFVVADGATTRRPLDPDQAQSLMFVAGEVAAVVLHRDLDPIAGSGSPAADAEDGRFAGWAILQDVEGREGDAVASRLISARFLVVRALLTFIDDDFVADPDALAHQIDATRRELGPALEERPEGALWARILDGLEAGDLKEVGEATLDLGAAAEEEGHVHGAATLYRAAYDVAVAAGLAATAVEAGRLIGRLERRRGAWNDAVRWYETARGVAREEGDRCAEAVVLSGLGNALRDKGNLPGARAVLLEGLDAARESGSALALGVAHHGLLAVEGAAGNTARAIVHGWRAVEVYPEEESRLQALTSLAGAFLKTGELDAADDAYSIVAARVQYPEYRFAAREALAHVAARRRRKEEFLALAAESDASGWREASVWTQAQILLFRGLSYEAIGERAVARKWLQEAVDFADANGVSQSSFEAEAALAALDRDDQPALDEAPEEMPMIRQQLRAIREALVLA